MVHIIAILSLGAACVLWYVIQRAAAKRREAPAPETCDTCELRVACDEVPLSPPPAADEPAES